MPEIINCPQCGRKLSVPENLLGRKVKCPTCSTTFTAEASGSAPPPAPAPEARRREEVSEERPSRRRADFEEDRPVRRRDDDEDDRPSRRRRRDDDDFGGGGHLVPHRGGLILTLGILSLVICSLLGPVAWSMGNNDLKEIRAGRMDPEGESMTNIGRICGIIGTVFIFVGLACAVLQCLIGAAGEGMR